MFHTRDEIRLITKEGLDVIFSIDEEENESIKIVSFVTVDNFDSQNFEDPHAILEKKFISLDETFDRLVRKNQMIKQAYIHKRSELLRDPKFANDEEKLKQKLLKLIYEDIYDVDYSQLDYFAIDLSFTILDWTIMERIIDDKTYDFSNVE